jgi:hypothetical protein
MAVKGAPFGDSGLLCVQADAFFRLLFRAHSHVADNLHDRSLSVSYGSIVDSSPRLATVSTWFISIGLIGLLLLLLPVEILYVLLLLALSEIVVALLLLAPVESGPVPVLSAGRQSDR